MQGTDREDEPDGNRPEVPVPHYPLHVFPCLPLFYARCGIMGRGQVRPVKVGKEILCGQDGENKPSISSNPFFPRVHLILYEKPFF